MPSLRELQSAFVEALFDEYATLESVESKHGIEDEQSLAIYRHAVFANYRAALSAVYPVVRRLIGAQCFAQASDRFVQVHPSISGDLHEFGAQYADFLAAAPILCELPYLSEVARLEWAVHRAFHARDDSALSVTELAATSPEQSAASGLELRASAQLIDSAYPVVRIWEANQPERNDVHMISLDRGGEQALVIRRGSSTQIERLERGEFVMLRALQAGATLSAAVERALAADSSFDLGAFLRRHVPLGTFAAATGVCDESAHRAP